MATNTKICALCAGELVQKVVVYPWGETKTYYICQTCKREVDADKVMQDV